MGLAPINCAQYTPRGGPLASMGLYGALRLPYSGPIAAPQSQLMIAADLGGDGEVGGQWGAGKDTKGVLWGWPQYTVCPMETQGWPHSFYGSLWRSTAAL